MKIRTAALLAATAAAGCLGLAACETATPYQPLAAAGNATRGGFSDQKLENDRERVTFKGNSLTSRETVETYLLYRAAELTAQQGYDWFEMVDRHTDRDTRTYYDSFYGRPGYAWGYWRPYWRYHGRGYGWRGWDPFWGDPFWGDDFYVQTIDEFEATAEIVMRHGPKPPAEARAFDARSVIANLGPKIVHPADVQHH